MTVGRIVPLCCSTDCPVSPLISALRADEIPRKTRRQPIPTSHADLGGIDVSGHNPTDHHRNQ